MKNFDFRSDTVTHPTPDMRAAMANAEVGDDVYGDDPTVNALERSAADRLGKEAALFVPSGTFGNQLALLTHTGRGDEVILGDGCHILMHEVGASSVIAGVQLRVLPAFAGQMKLEAVEKAIRGQDIHYPKTGLIAMENAHSCGRVLPLEYMEALYGLARSYGVPVHLDGARLFNAAAALGVEAKALAAQTDSVMLCLSKGLCAPVGSLLLGRQGFIDRARKNRKLMGGGMRQAGILAAAGQLALDEMTCRLETDHKRARYLAECLKDIPGVDVIEEALDINMVFCKMTLSESDDVVCKALLEKGIKINGAEDGLYRFVTHYWTDEAAIQGLVAAIRPYVTTV